MQENYDQINLSFLGTIWNKAKQYNIIDSCNKFRSKRDQLLDGYNDLLLSADTAQEKSVHSLNIIKCKEQLTLRTWYVGSQKRPTSHDYLAKHWERFYTQTCMWENTIEQLLSTEFDINQNKNIPQLVIQLLVTISKILIILIVKYIRNNALL